MRQQLHLNVYPVLKQVFFRLGVYWLLFQRKRTVQKLPKKVGFRLKFRKVGSDLDGVIAINTLDKTDYLPYRLHQYYSKCVPTHYRDFSFDVIITGRRIHFKKLTIQWLANNRITYKTLIMFPNKIKKSNKTLAEFKAKYINALGITQFYEDDENIAEQLKIYCRHTEINLVEIANSREENII